MNDIKLATLENHDKTTIHVGSVRIGKDFALIAGPCSVESEEQTIRIANAVKKTGANILRGGAF